MVYLKKNLVIFLAVLFAAVLYSPSAFGANKAAENEPGSAPYGVTGDGHAYGTKLYGVVSVAMTDLDESGDGTASYVMRLRDKNDLEIFFGETTAVNHLDAEAVENAILSAAAEDIKSRFGYTELVLKSVDEFAHEVAEVQNDPDCDPEVIPFFCATHTEAYGLMDIVFAAN